MKKIFALILILAGVAAVSGCGSKTEQAPEHSEPSAATVSPVPSPTGAQTAENEPEEAIYHLGEEAEIGGVTAELLSVEERDTRQDDILAAGKKYVLCKLRIENHTQQDLAVSGQNSFEGFSDGMAVLTDKAEELEDIEILNGSIGPGETLEGYVVFKLPEDWKEIELTYIPGGAGKKLVFEYQK